MKWDLITAALEEAEDTAVYMRDWAAELAFHDYRRTRPQLRELARSLAARAAVLRRQLDKLTTQPDEDDEDNG